MSHVVRSREKKQFGSSPLPLLFPHHTVHISPRDLPVFLWSQEERGPGAVVVVLEERSAPGHLTMELPSSLQVTFLYSWCREYFTDTRTIHFVHSGICQLKKKRIIRRSRQRSSLPESKVVEYRGPWFVYTEKDSQACEAGQEQSQRQLQQYWPGKFDKSSKISCSYISLRRHQMSELLIEGCPVVGECMAHHPLHPLPCCSIQDPVGTVPGKIEYFF